MLSRVVRKHLQCTPDEAMEAVQGISTWTRWRPGIDLVHGLSDPALLVATTWIEERHVGTSQIRLHARAICADREIFAYHATGDGVRLTCRWQVKWDDDRALVIYDVAAHATGLRHMFRATARRLLDQEAATLDALRDHLSHFLRMKAR